jgi:hypothetical protein
MNYASPDIHENVGTARTRPVRTITTAATQPGKADLGCAPNSESEPRDDKLNAAISSFQAELTDWKLADLSLSDLARLLHTWSDQLWTEFLPKDWKGVAVDKPSFLFLFEWESPRVLGHYRPGRNATGCRWEISLNPANLTRLTEIEVASVALHELLHCFEDIAGSAPSSRNGYHSAWLRKIADQLGIPCTRFGCTCGIRPKSPFSDWANRHGLKGVPVLSIVPERAEPPSPKRKAWICDCPEGLAVTIHVARGSKLKARCEVCDALFHPKGFAATLPTAIAAPELFISSPTSVPTLVTQPQEVS